MCSLPFSYLCAQALATEPLRNSGITIKQVTAKRSRLVIEGEMSYDTAKVPFTYRTSIGVKGKVRLFAVPVRQHSMAHKQRII